MAHSSSASFRLRPDGSSNMSSSCNSLARTNPARRFREPGCNIQASCIISIYDGWLRSAYSEHDVTLKVICTPLNPSALQMTNSSSSVRPRTIVEDRQVEHKLLSLLLGVPSRTLICIPHLVVPQRNAGCLP